jgi:hypothetical protein
MRHLAFAIAALVLSTAAVAQQWTSKPLTGQAAKRTGGSGHGVAVWGVGPDERVWKWDGVSWFEPNPAARLSQISVGKLWSDLCVWGLTSNHHIWKWDGASWYEPNPTATLYQISAARSSHAWGVGANNRVFRTTDGGLNWAEDLTVQLKQVSTGDWYFAWGITPQDTILFWDEFTGWTEPNPSASAYSIDSWTNIGAWALGANDRIFKSYDGVTWLEPNPTAALFNISGVDPFEAWGVGAANRVFATVDGGLTWTEPNPSAGLAQVSMGYE